MSDWVYRPAGHVVRFLIWVFGGSQVEGIENLPRTGAVIMIANHHSLTDPPIVGTETFHRIGRVVHIMAKAEIDRWPVIGYLARHAGAIFVRRGEGDRAAQRQALELLAAGEPLLIFPEGTRSHERVLREGKPGQPCWPFAAACRCCRWASSAALTCWSWNFLFRRRPRCLIRIGAPVQLCHIGPMGVSTGPSWRRVPSR